MNQTGPSIFTKRTFLAHKAICKVKEGTPGEDNEETTKTHDFGQVTYTARMTPTVVTACDP